jgi:23S rRNA (uracil1939-C5)-methyltransferase
MNAGDRLTLTVEKPAAGGRMIARHDGAVVLVAGAVPGEIVEAEIEKVRRGTAWARTARVLEASPDRVEVQGDWSCGGNVLAHVAYARQVQIKGEIVRDALARIGRMAPPGDIVVTPSPVEGYRMRARLHLINGCLGFFREGTHELCDAAATGQLLAATVDALRALESSLRPLARTRVIEVEVSENCAGDQRAVHLSLRDGSDPSRLGSVPVIAGIRGISCGPEPGRPRVMWGTPEVVDRIHIEAGRPYTITITRHAHSFFQGNRFLLGPLVTAVVGEVGEGTVLDLYAGVGVFALAVASRGGSSVVAVEGDRAAAADLARNAARLGGTLVARHQSVESFLAGARVPRVRTVIVDPPRTGMTGEALHAALALQAERIVYVSCDVATFARDARTIVDQSYQLGSLRAFDLFPRTAHVELLAVFERRTAAARVSITPDTGH